MAVFADAPTGRDRCRHRGLRSRRDPALRRRARFGDRCDPAPGLEGAASAGRRRAGAAAKAAAASRPPLPQARRRGPAYAGSVAAHGNRGRQGVPRRRHRTAHSRYRRRPVPRRDRPADRPPDRGRRRARDPGHPGRRPRRRERGRGRPGSAGDRRRRRALAWRSDPWQPRPAPHPPRPGRRGRRLAAPQGPAPGGALRQAGPGRALRPAARSAPARLRSRGAARTRRRTAAGASTATSAVGTCPRRSSPRSTSSRRRGAETRHDPRFWAELRELQFHYGGRPTPIYRADRLGAEVARGGAAAARVSRRGRVGRSAARSNPALPQARGPQPHRRPQAQQRPGPGSADAAPGQEPRHRRDRGGHARRGHGHRLRPARDPVRRPHGRRGHQAPGARTCCGWRRSGAEVRPVHGGSGTLKDAVSEALRDWVTNVETSHYCLGSTMGPHPYPMIVRDFQRVIGDEAAAQLLRGRRAAARHGDRLRRRRLERPRPAQSVHRRAGRPAGRGRGGGGGDRDRAARGGAPGRHAGDPPRLALVHAPGPRRPGHRGGLDLGRARLPGHRAAARGADGRPGG